MPSGYFVTQDAPFGIENVVAINDTLYAKTEGAFQALLDRITALGYDHKLADSSTYPGSLYASTGEQINRAKCDHCNELISRRGMHMRSGRWCEKCGKLLNWEITEASTIEIAIEQQDPDNRHRRWFDELRFTILAFDRDTNTLFLSPKPLSSKYRYDKQARAEQRERARKILEKHAHLFEPVMLDFRLKVGPDLEKVKRPKPIPALAIHYDPATCRSGEEFTDPGWHVKELNSHRLYREVSTVQVFDGKEIPGRIFDGNRSKPFPDSFFIVKAWEHFPLAVHPSMYAGIMKAAGMIPNHNDYLSRSGGWDPSKFTANDFPMMSRFVDEFTSIDVQEWDRFIEAHKKLHPAKLIIEMAKFCHPEPEILASWDQGARCYRSVSVKVAEKNYIEAVKPAIPDEARGGRLAFYGDRVTRQIFGDRFQDDDYRR